MNAARPAPLNARRAPPYDDSLFQMIGKGFADKPAARAAPAAAPAPSPDPAPALASTPALAHHLSHPAALDAYPQMRPTDSSNVFDPSEFPSLGGGLSAQPGMPVTTAAAALLASAPAEPALASSPPPPPSGPPLPPQPVNGLGAYTDLYAIAGYGDGRAKAVDAVTGSSASAEFNMQSEDFPALGGNAAPGGLRPAGLLGSAPNGNALAPGPQTRLGGGGAEKGGLADAFFDGGTAQTQQMQQMKAGLGRTRLGNEQGGGRDVPIGRPRHLSSADYQGSDGMANTAMQQLARLGQSHSQKLAHQDAARSPPKGAFHVRPQQPVGPSRGQTGGSDAPRRGMDRSDVVGSDRRARTSQYAEEALRLPNGDGPSGGGWTANGVPAKPKGSSSLLTRIAGQAMPEGERRTPPSAVLPADQYGMKGLLRYVGSDAEGTDAKMLSFGVDLTMLGLALNSPEPLHKTFANPWEGGQGSPRGAEDGNGAPLKNEEPDYKLPTCYYMQPPALRHNHFVKFQLETLFYVFYNMPRDMLQVLAAIELYNRKWVYHKDLKLWFTCEPEALQGYERGAYIYFDIKSWEQRPFHDANEAFIQGLMTEEELRAVPIPGAGRSPAVS